MPKLEYNQAIKAIRGTMDGWTYKNYSGTAVLSRKPDMSKVVRSAKQRANQRRVKSKFGDYHRTQLADPVHGPRIRQLAASLHWPVSAVTMKEFYGQKVLPGS